MRRLLLLLSVLAIGLSPLTARSGLDPAEATFDDTGLKDEFQAVITGAAGRLRLTFDAPAASTLSLTVQPDTKLTGTPATGLEALLCDPANTDLEVTGSPADRSRAGIDEIRWKNADLPTGGRYTLDVVAATPGGLKITFSGKAAKVKLVVSSGEGEELEPGEQARVDFLAFPGDKMSFKLSAPKGSKFSGRGVSVERPDESTFDVKQKSSGKADIDAGGTHALIFTNSGKKAGGWTAKLTITPRKTKKRKGLVSGEQTGLVPVVKKVAPGKAVHLDDAFEMTVKGKDFQDAPEVRLRRNGREDILATDIVRVSPEEITCRVNLDTRERDGGTNSVGKWRVAVFNAPKYGTPDDRDTLDDETPLSDASKMLNVVSSGSITLPRGIQKKSEVWQLVFNDDFATDLQRMGLSSDDPQTRNIAREAVEAYVVAYLRSLFGTRLSDGKLKPGNPVPISFVVKDITSIAGKAGEDYNRIEIGGSADANDPTDPNDGFAWGFAPFDAGNVNREDLSVFAADGTTRLGLGARTRVLNPNGAASSVDFTLAMAPLIQGPLGPSDIRYFTGSFNGNNPARVQRYGEIVNQVERASREIAAIVAHHIGRAMGLQSAGNGPMQSPATSGKLWQERGDLAFVPADFTTLRNNAVPHELPGKGGILGLAFFPLVDSQAEFLPDALTGQAYTTNWDFVGGRPDAIPSDYRMQYVRGSDVPIGMTLTFNKLSGTPPVCFGSCATISDVYCGVAVFQLAVTDRVTDKVTFHFHRLKILPDLTKLPAQLVAQARACRDQVLQVQ